ncbi:DUF2529 domain-containing protein [Neobacillus thermocopriae]|uniref:DUF2529 domain-containing protein n=1 Tax=Neobacillus thermocopriae TaxID=1215031 RepID=A0A6B3TMY4_9BACI|nr:DUF2529 domain-containing protein [Neobacillus thermocopriae]MED3623841.1 DUF2529 domain-containing protein [Neobacillus thermocopriae]MED3713297.1 DUF2529 domain-containing protein [Neobacillus thermocopriae]NEX78263.1 DUF2529 domain-containing protein [Neobacillus thermocopriae]
MLKMFTTQLTGLFKRIAEKEEFAFEDGARLLAQAPVGDGAIYIYGTKEMKAIELEALKGEEPFQWAKGLTALAIGELDHADRVIIFSRTSGDEEAVKLAKELKEKGIPFVAVSSIVDSTVGSLAELADIHIDLRLTKGLLPDEYGNRFGYPSSMAALFVYFGLKFTIEEILAEYE